MLPSEERTSCIHWRLLDLRAVRELVIAGWTGKDVAALEKHIRELEAIGVKRPKTTPIFYRVAAALLTERQRHRSAWRSIERRGRMRGLFP